LVLKFQEFKSRDMAGAVSAFRLAASLKKLCTDACGKSLQGAFARS
jgi:hypothetical protein